jgi:hypothetical protein
MNHYAIPRREDAPLLRKYRGPTSDGADLPVFGQHVGSAMIFGRSSPGVDPRTSDDQMKED